MVCAKCQKIQKTTLATPGVKRKNEMYYGSPAGSKAGDKDKSKSSATMGSTGIGKVLKSDLFNFWHIIDFRVPEQASEQKC